MKVINFFANVFAIFTFLTVGSLLIMVSLHILSVDDAIFKIRGIYENPWQSIQTGCIGMLFIMVGLTFAKMIVKKGRESDAIILQSEIGPIVIAVHTIEDSVRKVLKRFHLVKESKLKTLIRSKDVEVKIRLVLWSGGQLPELVSEIQEEVHARLLRLLGNAGKIKVICDVQKIEEHEPTVPEVERTQAVSL